MNLSFAITSLEQGLAFGIMALGVFISFRILDFADLTVDGSLPLGAAVSARLLTMGMNPFISLGAAIIAGGFAGAITGFLNTKLKIAPLLSGILTMTSLYSINLRVMGRPNIPLIGKDTIFSFIRDLGVPYPWNNLLLLILIIVAVKLVLDAFLNTQIGFALRATGDNPQMIRSMGISTNSMKMLGLIISNALVALSGALVGQYQGFADVNMGVGTIVAGLASVIIGEVVIGEKSIMIATIGVIIGSILYRFSISIALNLGLAASDLKLLTAILVIIFLSTPRIKKALR
ncbi:putative ABC transport system permease protein [Halanaerobium saccharolyticum]|uniref:Putative ABC transport system permease protein n=1 Tax=Halanaerobium saccharolyticum TaxID=43595 RepID=A0A4R7Z9X7_9FIRM|nr:ABC transporter permease [Halanaerobium saccharolyticum]RAK10501.1 putative ABC transport system permease protein [Halanaerobium saccharolyticum]TDW06742.1 putative ABC transport system permease protein [Halanaerobium saccharolyticum]TDX62377.1 putative ABC transport system permease protein [Halanaerobium saccharolyticum]